jgi:hypothetical protein
MNRLEKTAMYGIGSAVRLLLLPVVLSGCQLNDVSEPGADFYYISTYKDLSHVGRVALVELENESNYPQVSTDATEALFLALQKKQIFSLTVVRKDDPASRRLQLDFATNYTLAQLFAVRKTLQCNAVLVGTITEYRPYPHTTLGLHLRLLDLRDGELLWALEQVWDSADKTTEARIKKYLEREMRSSLARLPEQLVVVSPLKFLKFVGYEVAETFTSAK